MCIMIHQPKGITLSDEIILDLFTRNQDGVGVMFAEDGQLCIMKELSQTAEQALEFYKKNAAGRECALHYRMRTHGSVDLDNCHPYPVYGFEPGEEEHPMPIAMMHNGILHTGNSGDHTKSDTWHYIRTYLHKLLKDDPALAFTPEFADIIGKHIGSNNRFILMNHLGQIAVLNRNTGVTHAGAWFSNTYAWSATEFMPQPKYVQPKRDDSWDRDRDWRNNANKGKKGTPLTGLKTYPVYKQDKDIGYWDYESKPTSKDDNAKWNALTPVQLPLVPPKAPPKMTPAEEIRNIFDMCDWAAPRMVVSAEQVKRLIRHLSYDGALDAVTFVADKVISQRKLLAFMSNNPPSKEELYATT